MKTLTATLALLSAFAIGGRAAHANRSSHERAKVEPLVEKGETVGLKLSLTLRPYDSDKPVVRVSLGPNTYTYGTPGNHRELASDPKKGYLLYQWPEIKLKRGEYGGAGKPMPMTFELRFKDAPKVKPGAKVEIISTWNDGSGNYWHVWGLQGNSSDPASVITIPTAKKAAKKPAAADTAMTPTPAPKKPRASRARAMATAATATAATATAATATPAATPPATPPKKPRAPRTPKK
jgi:hypothetical protein